MRKSRSAKAVLLLLMCLAFPPAFWTQPNAQSGAAGNAALASDRLSPEKLSQYAELALRWEKEYLRINTTNPPGNEIAAARWFKQIFDAEGIESQILEYAPTRANVVGRIAGNSSARPLILLSHMDVVT